MPGPAGGAAHSAGPPLPRSPKVMIMISILIIIKMIIIIVIIMIVIIMMIMITINDLSNSHTDNHCWLEYKVENMWMNLIF